MTHTRSKNLALALVLLGSYKTGAQEPNQDLTMFDEEALEAKIERAPAPTPIDILGFLHGINVIPTFAYNIYNYTYPIVQREIFTAPSLMQYTPRHSIFGCNFFYQETPNIFACCDGLTCYLNVFNANLLRAIDLQIAREATNVSIPDLVNLGTNTRVEQRRVGFLLDAFKTHKRFSIGIELPVFAVERNYNLPPEDIHAIRSYYAIPASDDPDAQVPESAFHKYVVDTRLGIGDLRLTLGGFLVKKDRMDLAFGVKITAPTAAPFTTALIGSNFAKMVCPQYLDILQLLTNYPPSGQMSPEKIKEVQEIAAQYAQNALYQLNAITLATDLGCQQRWQAGFYLEPYLRLTDQVHLSSCFRVNWFGQKAVKRYVVDYPYSNEFNNDNFNPDGKTNEQATDLINLLSARLEDMIFPPAFSVNLGTQLEAQATIGPWIHFNDTWSMYIGYDYWYKKSENALKTYKCQPRPYRPCSYGINNALVPTLVENRLTLKGSYKKYKDNHNLIFDFGGDFPLICHNVGPTFTSFIKVTWEF